MVEMHKNPITFWVFYLKLSQYPRYQQFTTLCINSAADKINHEKHVSTEDNHKLWFLAIIILELAWAASILHGVPFYTNQDMIIMFVDIASCYNRPLVK